MAARTIAQGASHFFAARHNADVAEQEAEAIRRQNVINEEIAEDQFKRIQGSVMAQTASQGSILQGSPLRILIENAYNYERNKLIRQYNTDIQATQQENRADAMRTQGNAALTTSLITGAGQSYLIDQEKKLLQKERSLLTGE